MASGHGPSGECLGGATGGVVDGVPVVEVGLADGAQRFAAFGEPGEEVDGPVDRLPGFVRRRGPQLFSGRGGAEASQFVPGGEAADQLGMVGVRDGGQPGSEPSVRRASAACRSSAMSVSSVATCGCQPGQGAFGPVSGLQPFPQRHQFGPGGPGALR
jgi:hypothetical protein